MSNFKLIAVFSEAETGAAAAPGLLDRFRAELSNETPMALSRIGAKVAPAPRRGYWFVRTSPSSPRLRPVTTPHVLEDMLLWNGEVQYVCRHAARQSYGRLIAAAAAWFGPLGPFENVTADETI
jgi:hypothetical protein